MTSIDPSNPIDSRSHSLSEFRSVKKLSRDFCIVEYGQNFSSGTRTEIALDYFEKKLRVFKLMLA